MNSSIVAEHVSAQNRRFVVRLGDGAEIESVLYRGQTLCVSSQVGCAVRCPFCASGARGLGRNLELDELLGQLELVRAQGHAITGITVSGVGEPLHNAERVGALLEHCREQGIRTTLTTSGGPLVRLREFLIERPHRGITLSVHAGTEATRAQAVPNGPPLDALFGTLGEVIPTLGGRRKKRVALAYLLIDGLNDTASELDAFAQRAAPLGLFVHLYAYNPVPTAGYAELSRAAYEAAYQRLTRRGLKVRMSSQARIEANGGCGTLVALRTDRRASIG